MVFGGVEKQVASFPKCREDWEAFMNSGNRLKIKVGYVEYIFTTESKLISADNHLTDIAAGL